MKRIVFFFCLFLINPAMPAGSQLVRPGVTGIAYVRFYAKNVEQSRNFYNTTLGLPVMTHCPAPVTKVCITINGNQELRITEAENDASTSLLAEIAFATPEADAMRRYLLRRGLHPTDITSRSSLNRQFSISDPEGLKVTFVSQPEVYVVWRDPSPTTSRSLIHAGFVVHDRLVMDHFYKDILGFRPYWHGGMKDDETSWVAMQVPEGTDWVEYMLNISPTANKHTLGVMNHIALGVPDIHAAEAQLRKNGWTGNEQPKIGRDGKWQLNLYDPDDTRVELMEFTPTQKPCCAEFTGPHPGQHP
ncbi:MAG TPA: VOC family protein [Candidatus Eisenbacteria bacterium]|nr:VOC family protein [Candidatus Eisenbacteria bacterium]